MRRNMAGMGVEGCELSRRYTVLLIGLLPEIENGGWLTTTKLVWLVKRLIGGAATDCDFPSRYLRLYQIYEH